MSPSTNLEGGSGGGHRPSSAAALAAAALTAALAVAGAALLLVPLARGAAQTYLDSPAFCARCHVMVPACQSWRCGEHRGIGCHACHGAGAVEGARRLLLVLTRNPAQVQAHARVPDEICRGCHAAVELSVFAHDAHARRGMRCLDCHAPALHRFRADRAGCPRCHPGLPGP